MQVSVILSLFSVFIGILFSVIFFRLNCPQVRHRLYHQAGLGVADKDFDDYFDTVWSFYLPIIYLYLYL